MCSVNYAPLPNNTLLAEIKKKKPRYLAQTAHLSQARVHFGCLVDKVIIRMKLITVKEEPIRAKILEASTTRRRASATRCSMLTGKLLFLEKKPRLHPCSSLVILTDALENPLGLVLPPDPKEVNRDPTEDDCKANRTFLRCHPEGNSN